MKQTHARCKTITTMPSLIILRRTSLIVILACISFYAGYIISSSDERAYKNNQTGIDSSINFHSGNRDSLVQNRLLHHFESHNGQVPNDKKELMQHFLLHQCSHGKNGNSHTQQLQQIKLEAQQRAASRLRKLNNNTKVPKNHNDDSPFFPPKSMSKFLSGMARISKRDIMKEFDNFGVAILESPTYPNGEEEEAWLLYNTVESFPSDKRQQEAVAHGAHDLEAIDNNKNAENQQTPTRLPKITNLTAALENCDVLNVQFTHNPSGDAHPMCHLWIPSETMPSFHVDRWMKGLGEKQVLQHVPALTNPKGANAFELPRYHPLISKHWEALRRFLDHAEEVLEEIRSLIEDRMGLLNHIDPGNDNTIIVMTVNQGQSDLLTNFLCAAKSRQLDVRRVLVFVTDEESKLLVERLSKDGGKDNLGVMVYYDKWNMEDLPKGDAGVKYGDSTFTSMMLAKDVDIVWYKSPLSFFRDNHPTHGKNDDKNSNIMPRNYDIIFQHDGSPQERYKPYSANSGLYYVKSNSKTQYLFTSLLYHGDLVRRTKSHQQVLTQLLLEHSSLFGLRVKVMDRHEIEVFPGGYQYQFEHEVMRRIFRKELKPFIFHMFWTDGHESKLKFLRQMGEWYVHDECLGDWVTSPTHVFDGHTPPFDRCCSAEPLISCHYSDKPSQIPCNDSPLYSKTGRPFW